MLKLNYSTFMELYETQKKLRNEDFRTLHYEIKDDKIIFYLKSREYWEYTSSISFESIYEFGLKYGATKEQALEDYKTNVLYDAIPLESDVPEVDNLPEEVEPVLKSSPTEPLDEEDAKDYADFLRKKFGQWERKVFTFIDDTLRDEVVKDYNNIQKTFGEFLHRMFNVINTATFKNGLLRIMRKISLEGVEEAEKELNVDIGIGFEFRNNIEKAASRQLDGFYIDGKRWQGLKGVASDLQKEIDHIVRVGVTDRKSITWIKNEIGKRFDVYTGDGITEGRAMAIARTETNRFRNAAKLQAFKDTGIEMKKVWNSFIDNKTTEICRRLNNQVRNLDENFVDPMTGIEYEHCPAHPNCRSKINSKM